MLRRMTRARAIRIWFGAVALLVAAGAAFGATVTIASGAMLAALCLVPPAIIVMLWPRGDHPTVAQLLHDVDRRD